MITYYNKASGITIEETPQGMAITQHKPDGTLQQITVSVDLDALVIIKSLERMLGFGESRIA